MFDGVVGALCFVALEIQVVVGLRKDLALDRSCVLKFR